MKQDFFIFSMCRPLAIFVMMLCLPGVLLAANSPRDRQLIDSGWRFHWGDPTDMANGANTNAAYYPEISFLPKLTGSEVSGTDSETYMETLRVDPVATHLGENLSFVQTNFDDSSWRLLNLPHDWAVELPFDASADGGHGYKPVGNSRFGTNNIGWYRRAFILPATDAGKTLWLEFDGVYRNSLVWLNGHILGRNVSGYSGFYYDISQYAHPGGTNVLVARVDASRFEGWFYEGAGIYRHVWLVSASPLHVAHWGTYVTNVVNGSNATVTAQTQIHNDNTYAVTAGSLISTIQDPDGNAVAGTTNAFTLAAGSSLVLTQSLSVANARLWSLQSPNLYRLVSIVVQAGITNDVYETPFGIRTLRFDPNQGLFLNGQRVAIQGMCNHQDHAGVGVALPDRLQYYRIERLKEMGCNVYRTSHNPPTPELLEACDQLGMLVLDENRRLGTNAEPMSELRRLILRDRNHPSIFCWSMANEEFLQRDAGVGTPIMQTMVNLVRQLDPTRPCTAAMNSYSGGSADGFSMALDVQGFNYRNNGNMDGFHGSNPTMPCFGTEEASTFYTRGIYANSSTHISAYDVNTPGYGSSAEGWWQYYTARPWSGGACVWTGFDYRGEPSPFGWPDNSSEFGAMDTCGFSKDIYYYYQANWTGKNVLHIFPHWNWPGKEGQAIHIWCYSDCDAVELFLNGISQGMKTVNVESHQEWNVPYEPGILKAVGYRNGQAVMTNIVATTGAPAGIVLEPDRSTILDDGSDVSVVKVAVVDAQGRIVPTATNTIDFTLGGGAIIGMGNGDPACLEADKPASPNAAVRSVFNGLAEVIVQSTNQAGPMILSATAAGLTPTNVIITAASSLPSPAAPINVQATAGNARVWLDWAGVPGAVAYQVKRATASGGPFTTANTSESYFTDNAVTNGITYYYLVAAVNPNGQSTNSMEVSATPLPLPAPSTPTGLTAVPDGSTRIRLNWNASPAASGYYVKRSYVNGGPYATIASTADTTFVDSGLANTLTCYYVVAATNSVGGSANSAPASALPGPPAPVAWFKADAITNVVNGGKVAVWDDSSGNYNNAVNTTLSEQPTYLVNAIHGLPAVHFDAASSNHLDFNHVVQDDFTILGVFRSAGGGAGAGTAYWAGAGLVSGEVSGNGSGKFAVALNSSGQILAGDGNPDATAVSNAGFDDGKPHIFTFTRNKSTGTMALFVDGAQVATATGNASSLTSASRLTLGAQQSLTYFLTGDMAEARIYDSALVDMDRQAVEAALIAKYAIGNTNLLSITTQPASLDFSKIYSGVPVAFSVAATGFLPINYQWYEIAAGVTNAIPGATGSSFARLSQIGDAGTATQYFVVASNDYGCVTSSVASLTVGDVVTGSAGPVSVQFTISNYVGYSGFPLAPSDTAGFFALSNWNPLLVTPDPSGANTTVAASYLKDSSGVVTPIGLTVANVNDGWHQNQSVSGASSADARLMNTFWKANPQKSLVGSLRLTLTGLPAGIYDAYVYLMQNTPGDGVPAGYLQAGNGAANYFKEFINFNSNSNFLTAIDTTGNIHPTVNYLKLAGLSASGSNPIALTTTWTGGGDGIGVCGIQLVPPVRLAAGKLANGQFEFSFLAEPDRNYVIESSTNLIDWISLQTNVPTTMRLVFAANAANSACFYRVKY